MILGALQARMSSTRLPGKVLLPIAGKPMIIRQLERVMCSRNIDELVVLTSDDPSDDDLVEVLMAHGYEYIRGSLGDVYSRYIKAIDVYSPEIVVRLTGDCPLVDPEVIDHVIDVFKSNNVDYASNTLNPTFPDGLDAEVFSANTLLSLGSFDLTQKELEHVTYGIYSRPEVFNLFSVEQSPDRSHFRWTVDIAEDYQFVCRIYNELFSMNQNFRQSDIIGLMDLDANLIRTDSEEKRNAGF
jgi:spore coat polysaccharide biosynthesis protein SpsF